MRPATERTATAWLARHRDEALVVLAALAVSMSGVLNDFVYDDIPLIRDNVRVHSFSHLWELVANPYWPPPFVEQLYRPLTLLLVSAEYTLGGGSPLIFRLISLGFYAVSALAVFLLAIRLLPRAVALAVAVLFAAHPVHVEAVALGVNQAELIAGILAAMMLIRYIDLRRRGRLAWPDWMFLGVMYAVASLTKENGFVLPALLLTAELLPLERATFAEKARSLWRGYLLLAAIGLGMLAIRGMILGGHVATVVANRAFADLSGVDRALVMLQVVPLWTRLLVWPQRLQADYGPDDLVRHFGTVPPEVLGFGLIVAALVIAGIARRRAPALFVGLAWCAVGLLPVSNIVPTGIVLAERTLFLPSIGFLIAVGGAADAIMRRRSAAAVRRCLLVVCATLTTLGAARSVGRHRVWNSAHLVVVPRHSD